MFGEGEAWDKKEEKTKRCPPLTVHTVHTVHHWLSTYSHFSWQILTIQITLFSAWFHFKHCFDTSLLWHQIYECTIMIDTLRQTKKNMKLDIPFVLSFSLLSSLSCSLLTPGGSRFKTDRNKTLYSDHMGDPLNFCVLGINLPRPGLLSIEHFWWLCNVQFPIKSLVFLWFAYYKLYDS